MVAHGNTLNVALRDLFGTERADFAFGDTTFTEVVVRRDADRARLLSVNRQPHLEKQ